MTMRTRALLATAVLLAGCASNPDIEVKHRVPRNSTVAVVMFQDCTIAHQTDCDGSGAHAGALFARVLADKPGLHTVALPRPVGPKVQLSDDAAVAYAKAKGYRYVINGQVQDYYRAAMVALHPSRVGVTLRVLSVKDASALASYTYQEKSTAHISTADDMLEDMAKQLSNGIITEPKSRHQGDYMFYKGNNG
ncbi:MAG TPA: hypothetical protein VME63_05360 [Dyella sp.]|uniref:hypothetical protein n=1 Tax=Dyella sp. TaxID=1869338 RepID=UPI002CAE0637|nr:hypothetical protein [Dyella sp.]HTV84809.1 hypothetical protein [Dyella sp.]